MRNLNLLLSLALALIYVSGCHKPCNLRPAVDCLHRTCDALEDEKRSQCAVEALSEGGACYSLAHPEECRQIAEGELQSRLSQLMETGSNSSLQTEMVYGNPPNGHRPLRTLVQMFLKEVGDAALSEGTIAELLAVADRYDELCANDCPTSIEQLGLSREANTEITLAWEKINRTWQTSAAETTITESLRP